MRSGVLHRGIDFAAIVPGESYLGADILAAMDGVVVEARDGVSGFGCWVWLRHMVNGVVTDTIYGHMYLEDILVKPNEIVAAGQKIARVGNNGESTGAHLHFEIWPNGRVNGTAVDPAPLLGLTALE